MIKSMTGFGRCELARNDRKFTVEIKSVNHRYMDVTIKMPKKLNFFEASIRNLLKEYMQRGKIDVFITYEDYTENRSCLKYNRELAAEYMLDNLFVRRLEADDILPLHEEKRYLLVETSYFNPPMRLLSMLKHIREKGYHPLLAHPERYEYMQMADYKALQQAGVAFQLNIPSLAGMYGRHVQKKAEALQEADMYTLRGNDTHSLVFFQNLLNEKIRR